jgi:hypothetical protein
LYFNFFSTSFCTTFLSAGIVTSISVHVFYYYYYYYYYYSQHVSVTPVAVIMMLHQWCHIFGCNYCTTIRYPTYAKLYLLQYIYDVTAIETIFNSFKTMSGFR